MRATTQEWLLPSQIKLRKVAILHRPEIPLFKALEMSFGGQCRIPSWEAPLITDVFTSPSGLGIKHSQICVSINQVARVCFLLGEFNTGYEFESGN